MNLKNAVKRPTSNIKHRNIELRKQRETPLFIQNWAFDVGCWTFDLLKKKDFTHWVKSCICVTA
jgi:hypothetical protein